MRDVHLLRLAGCGRGVKRLMPGVRHRSVEASLRVRRLAASLHAGRDELATMGFWGDPREL